MRTHLAARIAAILLALEGIAIVALVVWQVRALIVGDTDSIESAIALVVLTAGRCGRRRRVRGRDVAGRSPGGARAASSRSC